MGRRSLILLCWLFFFVVAALAQTKEESLVRQKQYLGDILHINVKEEHRSAISRRVSLQDSTWIEWLHRSGELPPDFSQMKSEPFLPDPLAFESGKVVKSKKQWESRRKEIKELYQYWVSGHVPPAPESFESTVLSERKEGNVTIQLVEMRFGPSNQAKMTMELMIPASEKPLPVYLTQWTHRNWAQLAVRRGYIACVYAGADDKDDTQAYQSLYPDYDFTCLMRRAWGASRAVDYLFTRKEVDKTKIAITGHSRNGKQSLWAAAFDERISAVVTSSCGTGGMTPWRYSDPQYCNQTIDDITANAVHWFHPRLRFFFGHEDRLPVDQNELLALIAPRPLLLHYSVVEGQLNPWANEQCFRSVRTVYRFLGKEDCIGIFPRMGEHAVATRDLEKCIDFLDIQFGRKKDAWKNECLFDYNFEEWSEQHAEDRRNLPEYEKKYFHDRMAFNYSKSEILDNLHWLLGDAPEQVKAVCPAASPYYRVDWIAGITKRPHPKRAREITIAPYSGMGTHLSGRLYLPEKKGRKYPVVIYLHSYAYAHGYAYGYNKDLTGRGNTLLFQRLVDNGFAVFAIDMFGFGTRLLEAVEFYDRYPSWSKMGVMVDDVTSCVDAVASFDELDKENIFVLGNTIGGTVGVMAAALDTRIKAVASVASCVSWRSSDAQYPAIKLFADAHMFMPRLGWYMDSPEKTPTDFWEIMSCVAPRAQLVIVPSLDRHENQELIREQLETVRSVYELYSDKSMFKTEYPREINRISSDMLTDIIDFYKEQINSDSDE